LIQLDASFLIRSLIPGSSEDRRLREWLARNERVGISAVAWSEFLCGPVDPAAVEVAARLLDEPSDFVAHDAAEAARLYNLSGRRRGSFVDCMIAAVTLRLQAALATSNPADFRRFVAAGLKLAFPDES
jgi:predicted nucleic acid-binding protein